MNRIIIKPSYKRPYRIGYHAAGGSVRRAFWLGRAPVVVQLTQQDATAAVRAEVFSREPVERAAAQRAVEHIISAEVDLAQFADAVAGDAKMAAVVARLHGLKPLRIPDLWTTLLRSLTSQQLSGASARAIENKLAARFGQIVPVKGEDVGVLPDPATLLALSDGDLRGTGLSARKAEYARSLAEHVLDGSLEFERLRASSLEEVVEVMTTIRGVGRWTAECTALFGLGHADVLPAGDLGIQKGVALLDRKRKLPTPAQVERRGRKWAGWRSVAAVYLWRSMD